MRRPGASPLRVEGTGPDHARRYLARCFVAGQAVGDGGGAIEEGRRAGRRPGRGVAWPRTRFRRPSREAVRGRRCLSFPRSRPSGATSESEVVGRRIKPVEVRASGRTVAARRAPRVPGPRSRDTTSVRSTGPGKYLLLGLDDGKMLVVHLGMSGQLLRAKGPRNPSTAHPRDHHLHPGRPAALRGPADLRRDVRHRRPPSCGRRCPSWPTSGFDPLEDVMSWARFG